MLWNGTITVIENEKELRYWRNSYGLLGIILGVELPLVKRTQFQMYDSKKRQFNWTEREFWKYIKEDGDADIPTDVPKTGEKWGLKGSRTGLAGEFFVEWLSMEEGMAQMVGVLQKSGKNATQIDYETKKRVTWSKPTEVAKNYEELLSELVDNGHWGNKDSYTKASRANGFTKLQLPPISSIEVSNVNQAIDLHSLLQSVHGMPLVGQYVARYGLAKQLSAATLDQVPVLLETLREKVNDGFFLTNAPIALISAWFVEPEKAFQLV